MAKKAAKKAAAKKAAVKKRSAADYEKEIRQLKADLSHMEKLYLELSEATQLTPEAQTEINNLHLDEVSKGVTRNSQ